MKSLGNKHYRISGFPVNCGFKVILMSLQRLFLFILILSIGCRTVSAERSSTGTTAGLSPAIVTEHERLAAARPEKIQQQPARPKQLWKSNLTNKSN